MHTFMNNVLKVMFLNGFNFLSFRVSHVVHETVEPRYKYHGWTHSPLVVARKVCYNVAFFLH